MYTCKKLFRELASAYRNHKSSSNCFLLHGYCRDVLVEFGCNQLDRQGFVMDYGDLKEVSRWLEDTFDHVTVLQADDPLVPQFLQLEAAGALKLTLLPCVSCEGWAMYIAKHIHQTVMVKTEGRVWVNSVEVRENGKNSSTYHNTVHGLADKNATNLDIVFQRQDWEIGVTELRDIAAEMVAGGFNG